MNKEEILEKSRLENKSKDLYTSEVEKQGGFVGAFVALILASIFFFTEVLTKGSLNYGLYAVIFSFSATNMAVKAFKLKKMSYIIVAVLDWVAILIISAVYIYNLITA